MEYLKAVGGGGYIGIYDYIKMGIEEDIIVVFEMGRIVGRIVFSDVFGKMDTVAFIFTAEDIECFCDCIFYMGGKKRGKRRYVRGIGLAAYGNRYGAGICKRVERI